MMTALHFQANDTEYAGLQIDQGAPRTVLLLPDWRGYQTDYAQRRGLEIAQKHNCNVLITDLFGTAYRPKDYSGDAEVWIARALADPAKLRVGLVGFVDAACAALSVTPASLHIVGYCLGGALSFEMGRADAGLAAVASVHGIPSTKSPIKNLSSATRFMVIHGASDPIIGMDHVSAYQEEMTQAGVDWISLALGHARHGFTNEEIDPHGNAQRFDAIAARRCLNALQTFLYAEPVS